MTRRRANGSITIPQVPVSGPQHKQLVDEITEELKLKAKAQKRGKTSDVQRHDFNILSLKVAFAALPAIEEWDAKVDALLVPKVAQPDERIEVAKRASRPAEVNDGIGEPLSDALRDGLMALSAIEQDMGFFTSADVKMAASPVGVCGNLRFGGVVSLRTRGWISPTSAKGQGECGKYRLTRRAKDVLFIAGPREVAE